MTYIQFYILASDKIEDRWHYTQRLVSQSLRRGKSVHIHTACASDTRLLIERLEEGVLEKCLATRSSANGRSANEKSDIDEMVFVDHKGEPDADRDVLINLSEEVPHFFSSFETTLEVIHDEPKAKAVGRERYRYYQERGYPLKHQDIQPELAIL
jgi:DNA polymerase-3 subunit chi